ncbi:hypothetical protein CDLVIII_4682 [Clostridium sp. DL-VIII]|uniref:hypothetical protein n=1 Tax=Clostridium sp. DL-VIII TaxID=641107 RepID=UPI00023B025D|nr:hypothetical protein [Clostridium sp. DL-VIII]EHJ01185.1 hypothetical protein CDLVIII_4682 [Clostridium sp. DL-VIII]
MKKSTSIFLLCTFLSFSIFIIPVNAQPKTFKQGFYKAEDLNLSSSKEYTIQNVSFNERIYVLILDTKETPIQSIRLWPQSQKYNLFPLEEGYKIIVTGDGEIVIS